MSAATKMAPKNISAIASRLPATLSELAMPIAVLAIVVTMITPLPSFLLDILIVLDVMMSVVVMMVAMSISRPVDFSVFPTTLLLLTLFRLALNISSSRLILLNGNGGTAAAGHVIEAFGSFVVGGNYIIGAVIFLVLIAIQYVVINHGAVRISEVTARFTLDALPGKQMAIDADLNAGLIDETAARNRRKQLSSEAEFYGAMDGASRFTQRDAIASILITGINIIAGFLIGVFQHSMDIKHALQTYTVLTIGDGLVTVIPALMISVSGGLIVTRASSDVRLGREFQTQLFGNSEPLMLASGVLAALSIMPGMPTIPFLLLGGGLGAFAWKLKTKATAAEAASPASTSKAKENIEGILRIEPLAVEVGLALVGLVDGGSESPFLRRIAGIRRQLASTLGYLVPSVKVNDSISLRSREYVIFLKGVEVGRYELLQGHQLAIPGPGSSPALEGRQTKDPSFGIAAIWVPDAQADQARSLGYTVVDTVSILSTHLMETIRKYAHELLNRQDTKQFCDRVAQSNPKVVEDLVPKLLPLATVQKVLQNLLRERVSIRDGGSILEALSEAAPSTRNPVLLTEYVRQAIRRAVVKPHVNASGEIGAFIVSPDIERLMETAVEHGEQNSVLGLKPHVIQEILGRIGQKLERGDGSGTILVSSAVRFFLRQLCEGQHPKVTVLSHNEIPPEVKVRSLGMIEFEREAACA